MMTLIIWIMIYSKADDDCSTSGDDQLKNNDNSSEVADSP